MEDSMASTNSSTGPFSLRAHRGDAKTLLAFNLTKTAARNLAGFTIHCQPEGQSGYFLLNELQYKTPSDHAQDTSLPPNSSVNAPIHKFRWLHVPGVAHQGTQPFFGKYCYTVTPRYFDDQHSMQPLEPSLSASVTVQVAPFRKKRLSIGFTRGFVQSQAFVRHFGLKARIRPKGNSLRFDTSQQSGTNAQGQHYTFEQQYAWLGFTAREKVFEILNEVLADEKMRLDMFAYDLNEPDIVEILLKLAQRGRVRIILDNAGLHHAKNATKPEDRFEALFQEVMKQQAGIIRGKFGRYAHDKILIVSRATVAKKVLTGSTNFSVTGLYVNSNHVLVFDDPGMAKRYAQLFDEAWTDHASAAKFRKTDLALRTHSFSSTAMPSTDVTYSPHDDATAVGILDDLAARVAKEGKKSKGVGSVIFAVMELQSGTGPVFPALRSLHTDQAIFSYGISDSPGGIALYKPGRKTGVLVTGKPTKTKLPPPFSQVPGVGLGHQIHHKFVVCGFNRKDAVVYCGSSNLALKGEEVNGDNLLAIHDADVATVFAIEGLALVDHFHFLDSVSKGPTAKTDRTSAPAPVKSQAAVEAGWFLSTTDKWAKPYFDPDDLHSVDRRVFA
jgi:phosphatidylserine/phosphatidylglycerophosphate/cardiolipin synthase-like enzyme